MDENSRGHLSPGAMTAKRFLRNRLAVVGLAVLGALFLFSFVGGALIPYSQEQVFYREELQLRTCAGVTENTQLRYRAAQGQTLSPVLQAQFSLAAGSKDSFSYGDETYTVAAEGQDFYGLYSGGDLIAIAYRDIISPADLEFSLTFAALQAYTTGQSRFSLSGTDYTLSGGSVYAQGKEIAHISRLVISGQAVSAEFRTAVEQAVKNGGGEFSLDGRTYGLVYDAAKGHWSVQEETLTQVWDSYAAPSAAHPLGTDKNGMDMLTRLMYGGRVSLVIGFVVVLIAALLGVVLGGLSGYFGGWVDQLIMRIVDIFYCIPSTPLLIILGAAMDGMRVDARLRVLLLMLVLGFLGWPSIARLVRGQILSLREQEFMTAAESCGLRTSRRIFRHLIPNVIPQLIVSCTMSLGATVLTEATLSFLGLGVKFPFASWGNIMNDVSSAHVLTSYWFVWIPAGICLMLAVLGFNFVGDGLRDAFDPKMKR